MGVQPCTVLGVATGCRPYKICLNPTHKAALIYSTSMSNAPFPTLTGSAQPASSRQALSNNSQHLNIQPHSMSKPPAIPTSGFAAKSSSLPPQAPSARTTADSVTANSVASKPPAHGSSTVNTSSTRSATEAAATTLPAYQTSAGDDIKDFERRNKRPALATAIQRDTFATGNESEVGNVPAAAAPQYEFTAGRAAPASSSAEPQSGISSAATATATARTDELASYRAGSSTPGAVASNGAAAAGAGTNVSGPATGFGSGGMSGGSSIAGCSSFAEPGAGVQAGVNVQVLREDVFKAYVDEQLGVRINTVT